MIEALRPEREADVVEAVHAARRDKTKLDIDGAGTKAGLGRPRTGARRLSSAAMSGIIFYAPAEMTLSARGGTTIAEIEAAIAEHSQILPFEPMRPKGLWGSCADPTLGGVVATNLAGPRRPSAGAVRDGVLGLKLVSGLGQTIRCGGRVMKNVTGLDLTKLNCGAHGTLGVLTEATIKLAPRPEAEATLVVPELGEQKAVEAMTRGLSSPFGVSGAAWLAPGMGRDFSRTLLRLEGFVESVDYRAGSLASLIGAFGHVEKLTGEESSRAVAFGSRRRIHRRTQRSRHLAGEPRALAGGAVRRQSRRDGARPFLRLGRRPRLGCDRAERSRGGGGPQRGRADKGPRDADAGAGFAPRRGRSVRAAIHSGPCAQPPPQGELRSGRRLEFRPHVRRNLRTAAPPSTALTRGPPPRRSSSAREDAGGAAGESSPAWAGEGDQPKAGGRGGAPDARPLTRQFGAPLADPVRP